MRMNLYKISRFGSYDECWLMIWLNIKMLKMLKINGKALAKTWFASAIPARISSRFFSRHYLKSHSRNNSPIINNVDKPPEKKNVPKKGGNNGKQCSMQNVVLLFFNGIKVSKKGNEARKSLLDINCPLRVDQDIQIRSNARQHGNSYKTTNVSTTSAIYKPLKQTPNTKNN